MTALVALQLKNQARRVNCPSRILVSTVSTCRHTSLMKLSTLSFYGLSRKRLDSDRSRREVDVVLKKGIFSLSFSNHQKGGISVVSLGGTVDQSSEKEIGRSFFLCSRLLCWNFFVCMFFLFVHDTVQRRRLRNAHHYRICLFFLFESFRSVPSCSSC